MGKISVSNEAFLPLNVKDDRKKRSVIQKHKESVKSSIRRRNGAALAATRGLLYVGHIPHGFYEEEMKDYFSQFGRVTNVKVSRSKISGKSKGYGFVEFSTPEVAKIAGETMNNYLMFKKRVVATFIPHEKRPPFLFTSFITKKKAIGKFRQERHVSSKNKSLSDAAIAKKKKVVLHRLQTKLEKLKKRGIECEIQAIE